MAFALLLFPNQHNLRKTKSLAAGGGGGNGRVPDQQIFRQDPLLSAPEASFYQAPPVASPLSTEERATAVSVSLTQDKS